jgi:DNA polymerase II small subunit
LNILNIHKKALPEVSMSDDIISKFAAADILINDFAYKRIKKQENSLELAETLIRNLSSSDVFMLTEEILDSYLDGDLDVLVSLNDSGLSSNVLTSGASLKPSQSKLVKGFSFDFQVIQDSSKKSYTSGKIKDFSAYFNSRYQKLKDILNKRAELKDYYTINEVGNSDDVVKIIGIVNEVRYTKKNHKIIEVQDETGNIAVLVHNDNHKLFDVAERIVKDEVIGVVGSRKGSFVMASDLLHPGVPRIDEKPMDFTTVFISDTHIGSSTFLEDAFSRFTRWINGDFGDEEQRDMANDIKYLVVAGDIVDGIGVYPNQEKELLIKDIYQQYEEAARLFGEINDIKMIIVPGNHDASRLAEPQPAIPMEYAEDLYKIKNVEFVSNPSVVSLDGINVLIYHGRSFDDLAMTVKELSHQKSDIIMKELLEKRHLAPVYGERTPLASEFEDHLVIEEVPDVFHTGHVHINAYKKYKGVHMINSGTFQSQTEFQRIYNIVPTCGEVPVLFKGSFKLLKFA